MSKLPDPFREGLARGWKATHSEAGLPEQIQCDVAIIGSGAGAGITAELLTQAGLDVVLIEEGPLRTSSDFNQKESEAYATLYQEGAARKTVDGAITLLQGRCVGGTTVINWTSSFRTPASTLGYWQDQFELKDFSEQAMAPWFAQVEKRLNMHLWEEVPPNLNNELLRTGARKLGISAEVIPRNVKGCYNIGSCGLGCPTNAKQSMLVTTIPSALQAGARLFHQTRAQEFEIEGDQVKSLVCVPIRINGTKTSDKVMRVTARHYVVAGGAINSPALLKRSKAPDPHGLLGTRTFLHPVTMSAGVFNERVEAWAGAPQSIYSDHFVHNAPFNGPIGYKLEATPLHPGLVSVLLGSYGQKLAERFAAFPHTQMMLTLLRDGFHPESQGGTVMLNLDGSPLLHYPLTDYVMAGLKQSMLSMAEIQFAAGAKSVLPTHEQADAYTSWAQAKAAIEAFEMKPYYASIGSAHIMGGCRMGGTEKLGVVRPDGVHWQLSNLSVHDGSVFPTSIGANPQLSIYGTTNRMATQLAKRLSGKDVTLV
ncbi:GMC family oxidoreductase [Aquabacterium sp.]|uniref:GMC family oxidoreductase n=1 Tax=Aquabacterium sp. TaxID=1872578 RepID=UPI001D676BB4|nr:GMC family oxidoreductase [Aquabacterium sp.]MBT9609113.1 GMC family oxidoreductase [Aquabacterium sp.]|tara:strand:+ start:3096 stop:4709 length:1614 start_codon:yes stop_codon:yes gene_type:complete